MWQRFALRSLSLFGLSGFLMTSLVVLAVTGSLTLNVFRGIDNGLIISITLIAVMATTVFLLNLTVFQIMHYFGSSKTRNDYQDSKNHWLEIWNEVLWNNRQVPKTKDSIAAEALLEMAENLSEEYKDKFRTIYKESGLLNKDLKILKNSSLSEARALALEHLAVIADTENTQILVNEIKRPIREISILAFYALAKTYAHTSSSDQDLIDLFVPLIESSRFSIGVVEEAMVLLEANSKAILYYFTRPNMEPKIARAALNAIGYFANMEWAEWCTPWLSSYDPEIKAAALKALAKIKYVPEYAYAEVFKCLKDDNWFVRNQAVKASIGIMSHKVNSYLAEAISDDSWWVRYNAAAILTQNGQQGRRLLKDIAQNHSDPYARDIAKHFLG